LVSVVAIARAGRDIVPPALSLTLIVIQDEKVINMNVKLNITEAGEVQANVAGAWKTLFVTNAGTKKFNNFMIKKTLKILGDMGLITKEAKVELTKALVDKIAVPKVKKATVAPKVENRVVLDFGV
jgi:hypothetical protein